MKYNSHILLKAISDPVNSYTRIELHNVPNPPNSEIALPIHIKERTIFQYIFQFHTPTFLLYSSFMYILVVYYLFKNASNSFANDCTAFFLNTYFPSCISTNFAARNNFKWWCTVDLPSCNLSVISCNVRSFRTTFLQCVTSLHLQELYVLN